MLLSRFKSTLIILAVIGIVSFSFAQIGSESIGRDTMKMLRRYRSGNTALEPRRIQSQGAPKRIFQLEKMAQQQEETESTEETGSQAETTEQSPPVIDEAQTIQAKTETPVNIRKPEENKKIDTDVISITKDAGQGNILSLIPEKTLACLRVNQMDNTLGRLDSFLQGIMPGPANTSMIVRMQLAQLINDPLLEGINTNGHFSAFVIEASEHVGQDGQPDIFAGMLVPVSDSEFFKKNQQMQKIAADYALVGLETPETEEGRNNVIAMMQGAKLTSILSREQVNVSDSVPVWIYLNTFMFSELAADSLNNMAPGQANQSQMNQILNQSKEIEKFFNDTENLTIQLFPSADMLVADMDLSIKSGSALAEKNNQDLLNPAETADALTKQLSAYFKSKTVDPASSSEAAVKALKNAEDADVVVSVNTLELVGTILSLSIQQAQQSGQMDQQQAMGAMMINMMITGMASQVKSKIALAITPEGDNLNIKLAVPREHVLELIKLGRSLNQQQPGTGGPGTNMPNGSMPGGGMMNFEIK